MRLSAASAPARLRPGSPGRTPVTLWLCILTGFLAASLSAQPPRFRPLPKPPAPAEGAAPAAPAATAPVPASAPSTDPLERQFEALAEWPAGRAQEAAHVLAGLGDQVEPRLIASLAHLDWRVQAGSAMALARMRSKAALAPLAVSLADEANRMAAPDFMQAVVAIDPIEGTRIVLPQLAHPSGRIRVAARRALPAQLDPSFLDEVLALIADRKAPQRLAGLELLQRIPGTLSRREWFVSLGDREARVAAFAAQRLAQSDDPEILAALRTEVREGARRVVAYALLALVQLEDRTGLEAVPEVGPEREQAFALLRTEDPFYQTAAAIFLVNLAYRSTDQELHQVADQVLVPTLLAGAAGGVFFSDYASVSDLAFEKLALLTGQNFGKDAPRWRDHWSKVGQGFQARRRLVAADAEALAKGRFVSVRTNGRGAVRVTSFVGEGLSPAERGEALVLDASGRRVLAEALAQSGFFGRGPTQGSEDPTVALSEFRLRIEPGGLEHRRIFAGELPRGAADLETVIDALSRDLAWQRFLPNLQDEEARRRAEERLAQGLSPEDRAEVVASLALDAWSRLSVVDRSLAVSSFEQAPVAWRAAHAQDLAALLGPALGLGDAGTRMIRIMHGRNDPKIVDLVIAHLAEQTDPLARGEALDAWLKAADRATIEQARSARRGFIRARATAALLEVLSPEEDRTAVLRAALGDQDAEVRRVAVDRLALAGPEVAKGLLETLIRGEDLALRLRAIDAYADILKQDAVPLLRDLSRSEERREQWTAVRALGRAGGDAAVLALAAVVRESGASEIKAEAIEAMIGTGHPEIYERLVDLLGRVKVAAVRLDLLRAVARVGGERAIPELESRFEDQDPELARTAILEAARLGVVATRPRLLAWMAEIEGDRAAERALEDLTFFSSDDPSPPRRHAAHAALAERFGDRPRHEWFVLAAREAGVVLDGRVDWLRVSALDDAAARSLVVAVRNAPRPVRRAADRALLAVSELPLEPLAEDPSALQIAERAEAYERWIASRPKAEPEGS